MRKLPNITATITANITFYYINKGIYYYCIVVCF